MPRIKLPPKLPLWIATFFGCGLLRPAPGTWGSLAAVLIGAPLLLYGEVAILLAMSGIAYGAGLWASHHYLKQYAPDEDSDKDPASIVIDEVAGQWLALAFAPPSYAGIIAAFILFRAFDIIKPAPIGGIDRHITGAHGIMLDDMVAGAMAALLLLTARFFSLI